ncbi:iron export ABC transporter permease subunit FetB [Bradyrhizobium sp. ISRA443]|uniref:ABC transporter permease n=1 Tax=unclassified Bradyrhizobium TaxID=2631580 RepID=UPI00247AFF54|nr:MULTISPECIES: iron export ABC transporter permease subunit FetB [unclassified Bradyrhizobium]WGR96408.1 iron export ABC transporter permease subunit FetB [Bradyrhizobium sp. ISRA436]WGS03293.1 iron export ABC transporter permease subunit FetB [Bradyrhizobium sp. ISRA437]WGS10177.1 iron export ABC transporter permease subunit FetB [Bradyrhizobium sp. ISRA443]
MSYIQLSYGDLILPALLVVMNGVLSLALHLKLGRQLAFASVRMVIQLVLVGYVLTFLFAVVSPLWTALAAFIMVLFASREIVARQKRRLEGLWTYGLGAGCTLLAAGIVTTFSLLTQLRPEPWYHPRYALPLLGMILGNTMTGVSLGLDVLVSGVVRERAAVESCLALGGTRYQALLPVIRDALRSGFMPTINGMAAIGLVSLPGMMTGQILAGVEPVDAVKYQLLIMFLIAGGTGLGTLAAVIGGGRLVTDHRHRLRLDRIASED